MYYKQNNPHGGAGTEISLDFSANVNLLGMPPAALAAASDALSGVHRYPDPYCGELVKAIAAHEGVPESYVLCGNGAGELIYSYCSAIRPASAMEPTPTFSEYSNALELVGCRISRYPLTREKSFLPDGGILTKIETEQPEALFLCNPNNPTGRRIDGGLLDEILLLCRSLGTLVLVDECFLPLSLDGSGSVIPLLSSHPELSVLRAFTKTFGMAGLRLGYIISGNSELLMSISRVQPPWNVSSVAQAAGAAAMGDSAFLSRSRELINREREYLTNQLRGLGLWVCPSDANFLLFYTSDDLRGRLLAKGIAIRSCDNFPGLGPGWYRVAVRQHDENTALIKALHETVG